MPDGWLKITSSLRITYSDLMRVVDPECYFTLRDVLRIISNSKIPYLELCEMLHCDHLMEYWEESNSDADFDKKDSIEYLEVYWEGEKTKYKNQIQHSSGWSFHGIGEEGVVSEDIKMHVEDPTHYREKYGLEFSPTYKIADYKINIRQGMTIIDNTSEKPEDIVYDEINFKPSITLIELLYAIFWELSFLGTIEDRKKKYLDLQRAIKKFEENKKEYIEEYVSSQELKESISKKFKKSNLTKEEDAENKNKLEEKGNPLYNFSDEEED